MNESSQLKSTKAQDESLIEELRQRLQQEGEAKVRENEIKMQQSEKVVENLKMTVSQISSQL